MPDNNLRDVITVQDEDGNSKQFSVEALFDMDEKSYALLQSEDDLVLMQVVGGDDETQYLIGIEDPDEAEQILDAYQVAVEAAPAE